MTLNAVNGSTPKFDNKDVAATDEAIDSRLDGISTLTSEDKPSSITQETSSLSVVASNDNLSSIVEVPLIEATEENIKEYGLFIGDNVLNEGLQIPFYKGSVQEGQNIAFECTGNAVIRTARISLRDPSIKWLEKHENMTQLFIGLGQEPFAMVLGKPTSGDLPDLSNIKCFKMPPGSGLMIHKGTWHDFPMSVGEPVTVLTANSPEVVEALSSVGEPREMSEGDVFKINVEKRMGVVLKSPI